MKTNYFNNKEYSVPLNAPITKEHTYIEVINKGYAKYLDIINSCDKFIMYQQFYKLVELLEGQSRTKASNKTMAKRIIYNLQELGFIDTHHINKNKFMYLRKPAIALSEGDYNSNGRVTITKDLKNDKFKISILKVEHFLETGEILHSNNMIKQLKSITNDMLNLIIKNRNKYGYDIETIKEILKMNDYLDIRNYLEDKPEYLSKLDIIRGIWDDIAIFYRKLMLQRQTISDTPEYLKYFINHNGQIILHYVPKIAIFDVSHDNNYYKDKSLKLFNAFYNIKGNELRDVQKTYTLSNKTNMGHLGSHHIGYSLLLIGADEEVLREKKEIIDEDFNKSVNSPLMSYTEVEPLNIGDYLYHASRKGNRLSKKHNERINRLILKKLKTINLVKAESKSKEVQQEIPIHKSPGEKILDLLK